MVSGGGRGGSSHARQEAPLRAWEGAPPPFSPIPCSLSKRGREEGDDNNTFLKERKRRRQKSWGDCGFCVVESGGVVECGTQ